MPRRFGLPGNKEYFTKAVPITGTAFLLELMWLFKILEAVNGFVWGVPALILILGVGIYLTIKAGFPQIGLFPRAVKTFITPLSANKKETGTVSPFQALCTALAATVGTGNIAGVAGAIAIGGPGAIFWMWICALLGMVIKCAEATLAVRFRQKNDAGELVGGPMYMIRKGMGMHWNWLAVLYCVFGVVAAFGVGNCTQVNAVICSFNDVLRYLGGQESRTGNLLMGIVLAVIIGAMLSGGAKKIGTAAEKLVPAVSVGYVLLCMIAIISHASAVPKALSAVVTGAFSPGAVTGGVVGSLFLALRTGVSRGVFTNEAGMGTASIAHAGANVQHPVQQGLLGMVEVFIDTVVICTLTAMVILTSGVDILFGVDEGASLTIRAFSATFGNGVSVPIAAFLGCFALATILGWSLYGGRCAQFLFGDGAWPVFVAVQGIAVVISSVMNTGTVWIIAETVNGMMSIPNLIALLALSGTFTALVKDFKRK